MNSRTLQPIEWTEAEWRSILFYAEVAKHPRPLPVHALTARGASVYAARHLRGVAACSEILLARKCERAA